MLSINKLKLDNSCEINVTLFGYICCTQWKSFWKEVNGNVFKYRNLIYLDFITWLSNLCRRGEGASGNVFFSFLSEFFLKVETFTVISGGIVLKKYHIKLMKTEFLASGNHFLPFSATSFFHFHCCLKKWNEMVSTSQKINYIS